MAGTFANRKALVALVTLVVVGAILLAGCGAGLADDASGEEIFNARCASCHRKDLSGGIGPALGPGSAAVERPLTYYEVTITTGKGRMPSFGSALTEEQIVRVIDYVVAVQGGG